MTVHADLEVRGGHEDVLVDVHEQRIHGEAQQHARQGSLWSAQPWSALPLA